MYSCSNCGATMGRPLDRCPKCGVLLSGVRCQACAYVGSKTEFIQNNHRCPKCHSIVRVPAQNTPKETTCNKCGKIMGSGEVTCPHCGHTQWGTVIGVGVMGLGLLSALWWNLNEPWCVWPLVLVGGVFLLITVSWVVKAFKTA